MVLEPNRNRKPEPLLQEPKAELEPSEPFFRNRNQSRNRAPHWKLHRNTEKTHSSRNRRNRKPEPHEPPLAWSVTERNWTGKKAQPSDSAAANKKRVRVKNRSLRNDNKISDNHACTYGLFQEKHLFFGRSSSLPPQFWTDPGVLWKKATRAMRAMRGTPLKPDHFNHTLGEQRTSSEYCQTSTVKQRELWEQNGL